MTWVSGINTWKQVEHFNCDQRGGRLFRGNEFPDQWKWRGNIVFAGSLDEAKEKFAQQYRVTTALYCPKTDCIECPRIDG